MSTLRNNRIVVDLNKVQHAVLNWVNQWGNQKAKKPTFLTVRGEAFDITGLAKPHPLFPGETMGERAVRIGILDVWTPVLHLKLQANNYLIYTGDKALSMNAAWNAKIFGKKK